MRKIIVGMCGVLLIINMAYAITGLARFGSQHIDAYGIWLLKARAMNVEQGIPFQFLRNPLYGYSHQTYPLLLPLLLSLGTGMLWLYPVIYGVILGLLYRILRNEGQTQLMALLWTTAASFMGPLIAQGGRLHAGLADIWITLLVAVCLVAFQRRQVGWIILAVGLASSIKTEGVLLLAFLLCYPLTWKKKVGWVGLALLPFVIWQGLVRYWQIPSDVVLGWPGLIEVSHRGWAVLVGIGNEMANWRNWYVVWPLWWVSVIWRRTIPYARILGLMTAGYVCVYVLAALNTENYVASSMDRIMLQLLPLWWVGLAGQAQGRKVGTEVGPR